MYSPSAPTAAAPEEAGLLDRNVFSSPLQIRETGGKGRGVFATGGFAEGEVVIVGKPVFRSPERTWQTVQIDVDAHVRISVPFEFVNHSCDPNCGIKPNRHAAYDLVAMRGVEAGEEVTFDYCTTEWSIVGFDRCDCRSDRCRGIVRGGKFLSLDELERYDGYLAPYYRSLLLEVDAAMMDDAGTDSLGSTSQPSRRLSEQRKL